MGALSVIKVGWFLKAFPNFLSPFARNPIRDRGMVSVVVKNTWTSLPKVKQYALLGIV